MVPTGEKKEEIEGRRKARKKEEEKARAKERGYKVDMVLWYIMIQVKGRRR